MSEQDIDQGEESRTLGLERWVITAFFAIAVVAVLLLDRVVTLVWNEFQEPSAPVITGIALVGGIAIGFLLYRAPRANEFAHDVIAELAKVTWPTREETWAATIVVIVTSLVAAMITGVFDAAWKSITDLIYQA